MEQKLFHFDPETRELVAESIADESPLEPGVFLVPANATSIPPTNIPAGSVAVFHGGDWINHEDHRGEEYWLNGVRHVCGAIGSLPDGAATLRPIWHVRDEKLAFIKAERDRLKSGGFKVKVGSDYKWFHSDADSRIQHLGLKDKARDLLAAGGARADNLTILGQPVRWKTMDGSFATVTAQLSFDIVAAAGDLDARLFAVAETHRAAMGAAADPATYDFSGGWPETFGG